MSNEKYKNYGTPEDCLVEECAELIKAIMKAHRFGWGNYHPDRENYSNLLHVLDEMQDIEASIQRMRDKIVEINDD